jgi:hypothetical protein
MRQAEAKQRYVAIYVAYVIDEPGFLIGTTRSEKEKPEHMKFYNKKPTAVTLLWTRGQEIADQILGLAKKEIKGFHLHGNWFDDLPYEDFIEAIIRIGAQCGERIFTTEERKQRLEAAVTTAMDKVKEAERLERELAGGKVVRLRTPPRLLPGPKPA